MEVGPTDSVLDSPGGRFALLTDLPTEVLSLILKSLRPCYRDPNAPSTFTTNTDHIPWIGQMPQGERAYWSEMRKCTTLRYTCRRLNNVLAPLVYEELILRINRIQLDVIEAIFDQHSNTIRSISIDAFGTGLGSQLGHTFGEVLGKGIGQCSSLRCLKFRGAHCLFPNRNWCPKVMKTPPINLTALSMHPTHMDGSFALQVFGRQLTSLEIAYWNVRRKQPLHLPKELPLLQELTIYKGNPRKADVDKILDRTGTKDPKSRGHHNTPLRTLNLIDFDHPSLPLLVANNNIGKHLTTLRFTYYRPWRSLRPGTDPIEHFKPIFSACPKLDTLYIEWVDWILDCAWMPSSLRHLAIFVRSGVWKFPEGIIKPGRLQTLAYLDHFIKDPYRHKAQELVDPSMRNSVRIEQLGMNSDPWMEAIGYRYNFPQPVSSI